MGDLNSTILWLSSPAPDAGMGSASIRAPPRR
jgi:hypothetical protein